MSSIYLAARYRRHPEMQTIAREIAAAGHVVTSRWIWGDHEYLPGVTQERERTWYASEDRADLTVADTVISFTEHPGVESRGRGGRHVEFGMALALGKRLIVIGPRENVFHCLPEVEYYESWPGVEVVNL